MPKFSLNSHWQYTDLQISTKITHDIKIILRRTGKLTEEEDIQVYIFSASAVMYSFADCKQFSQTSVHLLPMPV